jgi:hypothetical protein
VERGSQPAPLIRPTPPPSASPLAPPRHCCCCSPVLDRAAAATVDRLYQPPVVEFMREMTEDAIATATLAAEMRGYTNNPFSPGIERALREDAEAADLRQERKEEREVRGRADGVL